LTRCIIIPSYCLSAALRPQSNWNSPRTLQKRLIPLAHTMWRQASTPRARVSRKLAGHHTRVSFTRHRNWRSSPRHPDNYKCASIETLGGQILLMARTILSAQRRRFGHRDHMYRCHLRSFHAPARQIIGASVSEQTRATSKTSGASQKGPRWPCGDGGRAALKSRGRPACCLGWPGTGFTG
jgi:hypothetical protein